MENDMLHVLHFVSVNCEEVPAYCVILLFFMECNTFKFDIFLHYWEVLTNEFATCYGN